MLFKKKVQKHKKLKFFEKQPNKRACKLRSALRDDMLRIAKRVG